jgi:hypothetical protein
MLQREARRPYSSNDLAVRRTLEAAGGEFIDENGGGAGVVFASRTNRTIVNAVASRTTLYVVVIFRARWVPAGINKLQIPSSVICRGPEIAVAQCGEPARFSHW